VIIETKYELCIDTEVNVFFINNNSSKMFITSHKTMTNDLNETRNYLGQFYQLNK
jgi:hypothetical protein